MPGDGPIGRTQAGLRERVRLLIELSRPREAVDLARRARASGDGGVELDELEALALIRLGDHEGALAAAARGLRVAPQRAHLHYLRSFSERAQGRLGAAADALRSALALAAEEPVYLRAQAELLSELRDHPGAIAAAEAARRLAPDRAANHVTLGFVLSAAGDKARARGCYDRALVLDPEDAAAWNNLGCLDLEDGQALAARARFREALRLGPEGDRARRNLDQTLAGRRLEGFVAFPELVRALAEELAAVDAPRALLALCAEDGAARAALAPWLAGRGRGPVVAAAGAFATGLAVGLLRRAGPLAWLGTAAIASLGARRVLAGERERVRARLDAMRGAFEPLREGWLAGRIERGARDTAARRIVEEAALALCADPPAEEG